MAVQFQSIGAVSEGSGTSASTAAPSGVTSGDLLLCMVRSAGSASQPTPTGWTQVMTWRVWFNAHRASVFRRIADGTGDDTPTITVSDNVWITQILRISGHDADSPIDGTWNNDGEAPGTPHTLNDVTITNDGSLCVLGVLSHFTGSAGNAPDLSADGYTLRENYGSREWGVWTGEFDSGTDGGATVNWATRPNNFVLAIAPDEEPPGPTFKPHWIQRRNTMIGGGII